MTRSVAITTSYVLVKLCVSGLYKINDSKLREVFEGPRRVKSIIRLRFCIIIEVGTYREYDLLKEVLWILSSANATSNV